ncbi:MAG: CT583 family protein [Candidatus Melainabacteria bacterium]|nr:CT583 family protein [Candidatus Melainabacteria bacterium]
MSKVNSLLTQRLKMATQKLSKMTNLVEMSSNGNLSSFSGVFRVTPLNEREKDSLVSLLTQYKNEQQEINEDLFLLSALTAEVKAINSQAIILHGERIKKAQEILKNYRDGAFSAWLIATYGNRQTPYNFLQYYELHTALPEWLHTKLDDMPRQAVYSLASRSGAQDQKMTIVKNYNGEPKQELLKLIRDTFPLAQNDKRAQDLSDVAAATLRRLQSQLTTRSFSPSPKQKGQLLQILKELRALIETK